TTALSTAMNTVPWTWPAATSRRPSGLQSSERPTPGPTGRPQRAHGWVGSTGTGGFAVGVGVTPGWCHETAARPHAGAHRARTEPGLRPARNRLDERVDVLG